MYLPATIIAALNRSYEATFMGTKMITGLFALSLYVGGEMKKRSKETLFSIIAIYGAITIINIATFFLYYPSMSPTNLNFYFLGNDNGSIYETQVFIMLSLYYITKYNKKNTFLILIASIILLGYLYVDSGNGKIFAAIMLIYIILHKRIKKIRLKPAIIAYIIITMIVVISTNVSIFKPILNSLGKSETISGRTIVWSKSVDNIKRKPLLGNGFESSELTTAKISTVKAHNIVLQLAYTGGIYMVALFVITCRIIAKDARNLPANDKRKNVLYISLILLLYVSIMDFYINKYTTAMLLLPMYYDILNSRTEKHKKTLRK